MTAELLRVCWVDRDHDRAAASDGVSRYGAYLRDHAGLFDPWSEAPDGVTRDPVGLARLELRWPVPTDRLPTPGRPRRPGVPNLADATRAVQAMVATVNATVGPILAELEASRR